MIRKFLRKKTPAPAEDYKVISTCQKLWLEDFLTCMEGDLSVLGEAPADLLQVAWQRIQEQFAELINDPTFVSMVRLQQDITVLRAKITIVEQCLDLLHHFFDEEIAGILSEYGFDVEYKEDVTAYRKQLSRVRSRLKSDYVELQVQLKEWDDLGAPSGENKPVRMVFEENLLSLSKQRKYHITSRSVTTYQYALLIRQNNAAAVEEDV